MQPLQSEAFRSVALSTLVRANCTRASFDRLYDDYLALPLPMAMPPRVQALGWNLAVSASGITLWDRFEVLQTNSSVELRNSRPLERTAAPDAAAMLRHEHAIEATVRMFGKCAQARGASRVNEAAERKHPLCVRGSEGLSCDRQSMNPVACSDGKCHADFFQCLRAMRALEMDAHAADAALERKDIDRSPFVWEVGGGNAQYVAMSDE